MIGDPGGKSEERNLLDEETVAHNAKAVAAQIKKVFGSDDVIEENNARWLSKLNLLEFLRDVGKYFTVNSMIKKDIVRDRLIAESPISFTEFSYSLLQGYDYLQLNKEYGCDVQVGGSDQWSNILAGVEFIRRKEEKAVYALTWPLIVNKSTGKKFGKSEQGAVWLDAKKTPPLQMYQFFLNIEDDAIEELMLKLTMLPLVDIKDQIATHAAEPSSRKGQRFLAREVTALVHGVDVANRIGKISSILFDGNSEALEELEDKERELLLNEAPTYDVGDGMLIIDALICSKLATSKREARQFISDGAVSLNGQMVTEEGRPITESDFHNGLALLKRGKRNVSVLRQA